MKHIAVKQGSPEWVAARIGIPSASNFDKLITRTGKPSAQADKYLHRLCAEWLLGHPIDDYASGYMDRGRAMEAEAVAWYEFDRDVSCEPIGFALTDDGRAGASPDRLVGTDGLLEVKCPGAETHVGYMLAGISDEYRVQQQGQLWVCERRWCDLLAFHPTLPRVVIRAERDAGFISKLECAVLDFCDRLDEAKARLADAKAAIHAASVADLPAELSI